MIERKVFVVMTVLGRVKECQAAYTIQDVLEEVYSEYMRSGSGWDRPAKLFIDGQCVIDGPLADIAFEYGKFREAKDDETFTACEAWVKERFPDKTINEAV